MEYKWIIPSPRGDNLIKEIHHPIFFSKRISFFNQDMNKQVCLDVVHLIWGGEVPPRHVREIWRLPGAHLRLLLESTSRLESHRFILNTHTVFSHRKYWALEIPGFFWNFVKILRLKPDFRKCCENTVGMSLN